MEKIKGMIYSQDALDALDEIESEVADGDGFQYEKWRKYFTELPSAQPEIIRCKECKHWLDIDDGRQKHSMCADIYGDWFCGDAERRTDG